jgi:hypothetical protein
MKRPMIACAAALVLFLATLVVYLGWYGSVVAESDQAQNIANEITIRSRAELRITAARTALANLAIAESTVAGYFVAQANIVPFIEELQSLGATAGANVSVLSVSAGPSIPTAAGTAVASTPITITLSITGSFDHVVRAAGAIEYAPYDLEVSSLALAQKDGAWQANMTVVVGSIASAAPLPPVSVATSSAQAATSSSSTTTKP